MKRIVRITIINTGGEFTGGVIDDEELIANLKDRIDQDSVNSFMEFDDESVFSASDYTSILHAYGPNLPNAEILVEESFDIDEDDEDRVYSEVLSDDLDNTPVHQFCCSNPWLDSESASQYSDDDLVIYTQKIEKRIHYSVIIECPTDDFDLSEIYIGTMNMDETISDDEIVHEVLYIPKSNADQYLRDFLQEEPDDGSDLTEYLSDIYRDAHELKDVIRNSHLLIPENVEGKGEWENDYIKITDLEGDVLFEDGEY